MHNFFLKLLCATDWDWSGRTSARLRWRCFETGGLNPSSWALLHSWTRLLLSLQPRTRHIAAASVSALGSSKGGTENGTHAAALTFSLRLTHRAREEKLHLPLRLWEGLSLLKQLLLCWGLPYFLPFPSLPICHFASGKWLCTYSRVLFQKVRLPTANNEFALGKPRFSISTWECLKEPWGHPQPALSNDRQQGRNAILNAHGQGNLSETRVSNTNLNCNGGRANTASLLPLMSLTFSTGVNSADSVFLQSASISSNQFYVMLSLYCNCVMFWGLEDR